MTGRVTEKTIVVTGGAKGIGRGCAEMLAREGANVVIGDIDTPAGAAACEAIREAGGEALFVPTDVTREGDCIALIDGAVARYGRLDGLLNNAGLFPRATLEETTIELWERVFAINLRSALFCTKAAIPHLTDAGGGSIVNMGSIHGIQGSANLVAYSASKGALLAFTRTVAGAYARARIRANYVIPGWILTETEVDIHRSRGVSDENLQRAGEALPLGRHQTVEDAAYAVLYLLSDESAQVTGTILHVDAGMSSLPNLPKGGYVD